MSNTEGGGIEADADATSDYESVKSDTTSVTSSIFNYVFENGHSYHAYKAGQYLLPNDESEQRRLDLNHHIFTLSLGGELCITKLQSPQRILDVGTGTGIWAIEIGHKFPSAIVHGIDLSPIQPSWVPPNVVFEIDDITQPWTFDENLFDFIHVRTLGGGIRDWPSLLKDAFAHLKPGGQIEVSDIRKRLSCVDNTFPEDCFTNKFQNTIYEIATRMCPSWDPTPYMEEWLRDARFEAIETTEKILPMGPWPKDKKLKEIGKYYQVNTLDDGIENHSIALFTRNGWQYSEAQVFFAHVRREILTNRMHTYTKACFFTGQKPATPTA